MWPRSSSTGTVSVKWPLPCSRHTSVTGSSVARNSANSPIPPSWTKTSSCGPPPRACRQAALVAQHDAQAGHEERVCRARRDELVVGEVGVREEDLPVRPVADPGAGHVALDPPGEPQLGPSTNGVNAASGPAGAVREDARLAAAEAHRVRAAVAVDLDVEPGGQGVDDARPDAVQATGGGVGAAAELAAGVQLGEDDLDAGQPRLGLDVDRDAAAVVADLDRAVGVQHDVDVVAVAAQRLVDRVVDDLPEAVHEAARVRRPDVHAGPLAHRLEALQNGQVPGRVPRRRSPALRLARALRGGWLYGHAALLLSPAGRAGGRTSDRRYLARAAAGGAATRGAGNTPGRSTRTANAARAGGPGTARAASLLPQRRPSTGRAPALHDPEEVSP